MVGLVIVSHSRPLGEALAALVRQVASPQVAIAVAAGVGEGRQEFGTDAVEINEAIQTVYSEDGVLLLMDLGSALLSAEMAVDLLPAEMKEKVQFCAGPIVEGAITAGVQASLGFDLETVRREAEGALLPKAEHLGVMEPQPGEHATPPELVEGEPVEGKPIEARNQIVLTLHNAYGLHARPAARFVQTTASFKADVRVRNLTTGKGPVSARSLNSLATLGAIKNHQIEITASGAEADQALKTLAQLVEDRFGEAEESPPEIQPAAVLTPVASLQMQPHMQAVPVSEGIALGPLFRYQPPPPPIPDYIFDDPEAEWARLSLALEQTQQAIQQRRQQLGRSLQESQAAIFDAHLLILQDPDLLEDVRQRIFNQKTNAAAAWYAAIQQVAATYRALPDAYLQQRAADVLDVGNQVLFALAGKTTQAAIQLPGQVILYAAELTPTETSQLDMSQVLGLITVGGGPTSHSAILARGLGIPAVSGASPALETLPQGTTLALDGFSGQLWIDPPSATRTELTTRRAAWLEQRQRLLDSSHALAAMLDGHRVEVAANIGSVQDARAAVTNGAEGVGLLRTEFLFLTRQTPPSEAEQLAILRQIGEAMGDRPIIVRTLDVGGDKGVPYINLPPEANPFLGVRAIRMSLIKTDLFITQLRAILRAAVDSRFRIMFPMVANLDEVLQARHWLEQAHQQLLAEKLPHRWPVETGIMVEIPSAALLSKVLAPRVDFFSIGTNDLTQYTLAAERGNPALSGLADALHPAVLRLISQVAQAAHDNGKWVGVCGELAGDPLAIPILVGLGVDELSMNPASIPRAKDILRSLTLHQANALAVKALEMESAPAVRQLAKDFSKS